MTRSTTELQQQPNARAIHRRRAGAAYGGSPPACQGIGVDDSALCTDRHRMSKTPTPANRARQRRLAEAPPTKLLMPKARTREAKAERETQDWMCLPSLAPGNDRYPPSRRGSG